MGAEHLHDLLVAASVHHVEAGVKNGETCKMDMGVREGGQQCPPPKFRYLDFAVTLRKGIPNVDDASLILHQIAGHCIFLIASDD